MRILALLCASCLPVAGLADVTFFSDLLSFEFFNSTHGYVLGVGTETFEENSMGSGEMANCDDPLVQGVANGPFPTGLDHALTIQSNTLGGAPSEPSPRGDEGLLAMSEGVGYGEVSDIVLSAYGDDSLDIILPAGDFRSVSFNVLTLFGDPVEVRVYDRNDNLIGQADTQAKPWGIFLGLGVEPGAPALGRINLYAPQHDWEGADNVDVFYVPEPGSLVALLAAGLALSRRRA